MMRPDGPGAKDDTILLRGLLRQVTGAPPVRSAGHVRRVPAPGQGADSDPLPDGQPGGLPAADGLSRNGPAHGATTAVTGDLGAPVIADDLATAWPTGPCLPGREADRFRGRWDDLQATFVDNPRAAVHEANGVIADVVSELGRALDNHRAALEVRWSRGDPGTEHLRQLLHRYRALLDRLLRI